MFKVRLHYYVKRSILSANARGRDFCLGDLHGCIMPLFRLMRAAKFNRAVDRLFSVGDLIDRGANSSRCLRLLNRTWFYPVLGNHDIAFVVNQCRPPGMDWYERDYYDSISDHTGGWYMTPPYVDFSALCKKLNRLPHIITVGRKKPEFHVVHSSLHPLRGRTPVPFSDEDIGVFLNPLHGYHNIENLTRDRGLFKTKLPARTNGLAITFCGHTPVRAPVWVLNHLNLDTGAGYGDERAKVRLTMACATTKELWSTPTNKPGRVTCRPFPK